MKLPNTSGLCGALFACFALQPAILYAAPPCKGPNKNDPGCGAEEPAPPPVVVDSVEVDWFNQSLVVRGSGLSGVTSFGLGGFAGPLATANVTDIELDLVFNADMAGEVLQAGSYALTADGTQQLTVFIDSQIVDPAAAGCPCDTDWQATLASWGTPETECLEIEGPGSNDPADISGTVLTDPVDPAVYPHFPVGASFYPGLPNDSVCRLVQVNADASLNEIVNLRINETQQADCRALLATNVCSVITPLP
ncbi:MAG: hypothetical protein R3348_06045 [Xanthomonadales bacterium]|nr:hypothetical protein [Xanthomonadales bacterium]